MAERIIKPAGQTTSGYQPSALCVHCERLLERLSDLTLVHAETGLRECHDGLHVATDIQPRGFGHSRHATD